MSKQEVAIIRSQKTMKIKTKRRLIRELPLSQQPAERLAKGCELSITELLAVVLNTPDGLDLAQELISKFSISELPLLTLSELQSLSGIGPVRAKQLVAAIELGSRLINHTEERPEVRQPLDVGNLLMSKMRHLACEHFVVLLMNMKNKVIKEEWLYKGTLNSSVIRVSEVYRQAIRRQAAAIIVAHNHPSGDPTPSPEDIRVTRDIRQAGTLLDIELLDHVIVGHGRWVSMRERNLGF